nr:hypothetical protein [Tanacetum cinerariifolium]
MIKVLVVKNARSHHWTMDMTIDQQVALDETLVPHASRLWISKSNFRLTSNITYKESTLQLVYDVLRLTPFYKAFLVTADVPEIYLQEFWETAIVHHHLIRFKMDNKKRIVNLEYFREMLHICPRLPGQTFDELPFEEEVLAFLRFLGHSGEIRKLTDVNINKLHQPWRSFAAEEFVYHVEHKDAKKSNEMYYPRKTKSSSDTIITPPTAAGTRLDFCKRQKQPAKASKAKGLIVLSEVAMTEAKQEKLATKKSLQQTHISQASGSVADEGTGIIPGVPDVPTKESDEEISWKSSDEDDDDEVDDQNDDDDQDDDDQDEGDDDDQDTDNDDDEFVHPKLSIHEEEETKDEERFDPIVQTPENSNDEGNDDASLGLNVGSEEGQDEEDDDDELYRDVNINLEGRDVQMTNVHTTQEYEDTHVTLTLVNLDGQQQIKVVVQIQSDRLRDEAQAENEEFLKNFDENIQKIIKEQDKEQVKVHVSKILPKIEKTVNKQLEADVLTRSSNSSKTSYVMAADLSEMELKKILIEKMERTKSIHRSNEQMNLYKALVEAYESDKIIFDIYGDTVTLKRCRDDEDKDKEPFVGSDRGTKSESAPVEELMQTTQYLEEPSHQEFETGAYDDQPIAEASQHLEWFQQQKKPPTPYPAWNKTLPATHGSIQLWISDLAKQADSRSSFNELMDTHVDFSAFLMNRLKVDTLTPELLAGPTYELMKGSCKSLVELEFFLEEVYKATTDQLDWNNPEGQQYPHNLLKPLPLIPNS